jgi:hypothetical protein
MPASTAMLVTAAEAQRDALLDLLDDVRAEALTPNPNP